MRSLARLRHLPRLAFACWIALVLSGSGLGHACPMHDAAGAAPGARSHAGLTHAGMTHAGMGHHGSVVDPPATAPDTPSSGHHGCSCIGDCCAVVAAVPADGPVCTAGAVIQVGVRTLHAQGTIARAPQVAHAQPPAQAPPAAPV